jgi:hypothetical protein
MDRKFKFSPIIELFNVVKGVEYAIEKMSRIY